MLYYHGKKKYRNFFEGWYFKHQNEEHTISFIPGVQMDENSCSTAFIQVITLNESHYFTFPIKQFHADEQRLLVQIGRNVFSELGIQIDIDQKDEKGEHVKIKGFFMYGSTSRFNSNMMGPMKHLPLSCKHGVISMQHAVYGKLLYNHRFIKMMDGYGYIETDYGHTFPKNYFWTQCNHRSKHEPQIMAAVATVPIGCCTILGTIAAISYEGMQYKLATYKGARIRRLRKNLVVISQGKFTLVIKANPKRANHLKAPVRGKMSRIIQEKIECEVSYQFYYERAKIFDFSSKQASYEYVTK